MRLALLSWTLIFAFLAAGFGTTVLALNGDVFSAHGFVRSYLEALARKDADEALGFAGVVVPASESGVLLTDAALGSLSDIHFLRDDERSGVHTVTFSFRLGADRQTGSFAVTQAGTTLGLFSTWRFAESPLATLAVTVLHDSRFTVNDLAETGNGSYAVFRPGLYTLAHSTKYLSADAVAVAVTEPGTTAGKVDVKPTPAFTAAATKAVAAFLTTCAAQKVLMPTGCPFGYDEPNRIKGLPTWAIVEFPAVTLAPGTTPGSWTATGTKGTATIDAVERALFDGTISHLDKKVSFEGTYLITLSVSNELSVSDRP